jgi:hypothetical protein
LLLKGYYMHNGNRIRKLYPNASLLHNAATRY